MLVKKVPILLATTVLCIAIALGIAYKHNASAERQKVKREQAQTAEIIQKPAYLTVQRIFARKREIEHMNISSKERARLLDEERNAAIAEYNRVVASGYRKPYDIHSQ